MSASIDEAFVEEFESLVHHLGQQQVSRLYGHCRKKSGTASVFNFERLASEDMIVKASRHEATPILDVAHSRRKATVETWKWGEAIDQDDEVKILINPESEYTQAAAMAHGRKIDDILIAAAVGDATTGDGSTVALPAGQKIGDGLGVMTTALFRQAAKLLNQAEVQGRRVMAISAQQLDDMLADTEAQNSDYNTVKALVDGELNTWLGFDIIRTELVPLATTVRSAVAYCEPCIGLGLAEEKLTRIAEDPSLSFATRVYMELAMGAVRIEDTGVVQIDTVEA